MKPYYRLILLLLPMLFFSTVLYAQKASLAAVKIDRSGNVLECKIRFTTGYDTFFVLIDGKGMVLGFEIYHNGVTTKIDYFDEFAENFETGKPSTFLNSEVKYFPAGEIPEKVGRIFSIGYCLFDYYSADPDKAKKLMQVGNIKIDYYSRNNDASLVGRISKIGDIPFDYFDNMSDVEKAGKVKTIGNLSLDYFTTYDNDLKAGKISLMKGIDERFELVFIYKPLTF